MSGTRTAEHGSRVSARGRIVGWIVLTTALALLAVMVTMRSVLLGQLATRANHDIVQEVDEFSTFAAEGVDPTTAAPFASVTAMMERYLARQTPATGETLIAVTPTDVFFSDNAANDAGELLAGDRGRLQELLAHPQTSGITTTPQGELRWGRTSAQVGGQTGTLVVGIFTGDAREQVDRDTLLLLGVAAGGLLLTAGMAWLAAGQILRPIRRIGRVADDIDAQDLSGRVPVEGRDDIARLAVTFNEMLDRLERSQAASRHFVQEAQHHLQEPRAALTDHLQALEQGGLDDRQIAARVRGAHRQLDLMSETLADLELLSRHERPDFLQRRPVDASNLTHRVVDLAAAHRPGRRWALQSAAAGSVVLDPDRVTDAMTQLVRNAYGHTREGDEIRIGSELLGDGPVPVMRLWIGNDGPPLDPDQARALFEEYRSADADGSGMGLGLAVVRAVADAHGGSAWVESSAADGNRFGLDLPSREVEVEDVADEHVEQLTTALRQEQ